MLKLSIIGCGNVAKTMAHLWYRSGNIELVDIVNRSQTSAEDSVDFIGSGMALNSLDNIRIADVFVIGCGDDHIEHCLDALLKQNVIKPNNIVFHFSGAKSSRVLDKAKTHGALCASLHPVKSFANPTIAVTNFADTYCGLEGDAYACEVLTDFIASIGGHCFKVDSDKKLTYHAASVFACNYMTALQELSIKALEHSGIERSLAMNILEPIVKETADNIFKLGTAKALTGPIARGDGKLIKEQLHAVEEWDADAAEIYRLLGKLGIDLSDEKGVSNKQDLAHIKRLFK